MNIYTIIHSISSFMEKPVIVLLLILIVITALLVGSLIGEFFTEHRHLDVAMPQLITALKNAKKTKGGMEEVINGAGLFVRQKECLLELISHPDYSDFMRESLAVRILKEEQNYYDRRILITDLIAKLAPMLGLLGTLIPLGPGIIALSEGDTVTLSESLLTAFDTTVVGLICAGVATLISAIRNQWYKNYMSIMETLMECILDIETKDAARKASLKRAATKKAAEKAAAKKATAEKAAAEKAVAEKADAEKAAAEKADAEKAAAEKAAAEKAVAEKAVTEMVAAEMAAVEMAATEMAAAEMAAVAANAKPSSVVESTGSYSEDGELT